MAEPYTMRLATMFGVFCTVCAISAGCTSIPTRSEHEIVPASVPKELNKVSLPTYVVEPPDILLVDVIRAVPKAPYKIAAMDALLIQATGVLPTDPIAGVYTVDPDGTVNLGLEYRTVKVVGLSLEGAKAKIEEHLKVTYKDAKVVVALAQSGAQQQIRGDHLVRPDGTIGLGTYGNVYVTGLTLSEAKNAIESQLKQHLEDPKVSVDVFAYNSKVYYVITDGAGYGEQVVRFPLTGNETVLDAVSQINGLPAMASKRHIWVARPAPGTACGEQTLPVDWCAITRKGSSATNYQVLPGDRIYVEADPLITFDNTLAKALAPIERVFGAMLLGGGAVNEVTGRNNNGNGNNTGR
jgi:polysaccharide biosynthesis/export protein